MIGRPDLAKDERFSDMRNRAVNAEACVRELDATFRTKSLAQWREQLAGFSGVWAPVLAPAELHGHPQVDANGYLPSTTTTGGVTYRTPAPPMQFGEPTGPAGAAPEMGQHTEEILLELHKDWDEICALRANGALG